MIMDIQASLSASERRILKLFNDIKNGDLILRPYFQRKLVWKKTHKYHFIETILRNYPFPEIYIATGDMDVENLEAKEWVVDGQQRLSTIYDYITSSGDFENQSVITPFDKLEDKKKQFLEYKVIVRDLGNINQETIQEIFKRINNTEYSLNKNEKLNASYSNNSFLLFCKQLIDDELSLSMSYVLENSIYSVDKEERKIFASFFSNVFNDNDIRRMNDLLLIMTLVTTMEIGYFNRRIEVDNFLDKYNESYNNAEKIKNSLLQIVNFIRELNLEDKSYWFNKTNIFSLIVELSRFNLENINKSILMDNLMEVEGKYKSYRAKITDDIDSESISYFILAKEAVNDKKSRIQRGEYLYKVINNSLN